MLTADLRPKVLIADDQRDVLHALRLLLNHHGFEIVIGDQGSPAFWEKFYRHVGNIDVLLDRILDCLEQSSAVTAPPQWHYL